MSIHDISIRYIKGIGEKRAQLLSNKLGLYSLSDMLTFFPRAYQNWSDIVKICDVNCDENANRAVCIKAKIFSEITEKVSYKKGITTYSFLIYDRTGEIKVVIFANKYLAKSLKPGNTYLFYGRVKYNGKSLEMLSPEIKSSDSNYLHPIYKTSAGISSKMIESYIKSAINSFNVEETLPQCILNENHLISKSEAIKNIHFPSSEEMLSAAQRRLAFEELFFLTLGFKLLKSRNRKSSALPITPVSDAETYNLFPFKLTKSQNNVIKECEKDMSGSVPMNRLIQGDVGSGKTAVAAALCYNCFKNKKLSVVLAPTEILASQHFETFSSLFKNKGIKIELLTGALSQKRKKEIKAQLNDNRIDILIATHAVLSDDVELPNTALIVTDEQHRFGVSQRAALNTKANSPHTLVMSATPIPRTLGLVIYGDLDISTIKERPSGRKPIKTFSITSNLRTRALNYVKKHIENGLQGYIVCPAIDENEDIPLLSATEYITKLKEGIFKDYPIALLHGKMKSKEKDQIMNNFLNGNVKLLVSTTVVEVGIDVPNAAIMVVENADRFGLSQLHQLRGRIGRGSAESTCILISDSKSQVSKQRLRIMCSTEDGFKIAEEDLKLRGPGNFLGNEQHGLPKLKIADILNDDSVLYSAAEAAEQVYKSDPTLSLNENKKMLETVEYMFMQNRKILFN